MDRESIINHTFICIIIFVLESGQIIDCKYFILIVVAYTDVYIKVASMRYAVAIPSNTNNPSEISSGDFSFNVVSSKTISSNFHISNCVYILAIKFF